MKTLIEMAREVGIHVYPEFELAFARFAELARAEEREACEKVCELVAREIDDTNGTASYIAAAIRARGIK
jgi:lysylphosphatidylglycerol synthetase-like protein (DUF2156 family)